jgi:hypothetical protein
MEMMRSRVLRLCGDVIRSEVAALIQRQEVTALPAGPNTWSASDFALGRTSVYPEKTEAVQQVAYRVRTILKAMKLLYFSSKARLGTRIDS